MKRSLATVCVLVLGGIGWLLLVPRLEDRPLTWLYHELSQNRIKNITWQGTELQVKTSDGTDYLVNTFDSRSPAAQDLVKAALAGKSELTIVPRRSYELVLALAPVVIFAGLLYVMFIRPASGFKPPRMDIITRDEVQRILDRSRTFEGQPRVRWAPGDTLRVVDGPFEGMRGRVDSVEEARGRVSAIVDVFGRATPIELHFMDIEKV